MVRECRLFGSWSLVCSSVYSCIAHPLLVCRSSASSCIARASARPSARPPARASLACRSFAAALLESWALVRLIIRYSSVCSCIVHLLLTCPLVHICSCIGCASLVCLFLCRSSVCSSLPRRWSAVDLSRVHCSFVYSSFCWSAAFLSLVYRCSVCWGRGRCSVCCSAVGPPAPLSVRPSLVSHWSVAGLSVRQSLLCHLSVAVPSPRAVVADLSARLLLVAALPLVCRSAAPLDSPCIPILLVEFGRHAVHTHSVPRVVSRHSVITHSLFHSCSHRRCCLVWSSA